MTLDLLERPGQWHGKTIDEGEIVRRVVPAIRARKTTRRPSFLTERGMGLCPRFQAPVGFTEKITQSSCRSIRRAGGRACAPDRKRDQSPDRITGIDDAVNLAKTRQKIHRMTVAIAGCGLVDYIENDVRRPGCVNVVLNDRLQIGGGVNVEPIHEYQTNRAITGGDEALPGSVIGH